MNTQRSPAVVGLMIALAHLMVIVHASPPRPHIVFVLADDLGYNDVGFHSTGSKIETPRLDALAAGGVKLENYYVQQVCTPTRGSLLTGKYPIHTGMQTSQIFHTEPRCLPTSSETIADLLSEAGYATHMVGKWHLGMYKKECWPINRGFDSFFGHLLGSGDHFSHTSTERPSRADEICGGEAFTGMDLWDGEENVQPDFDGKYSSTIFTKRAQKIIENHNPDESLFLYLPYQAAHLPFEAPVDFIAKYPPSKIADGHRRIYAAMVTYLDESIGNLTDTLKQEGMWDDTVFVFSTDNGGLGKTGGGNNWPLRGMKGNAFEGGIRAVGFVASPLLSDSVIGTSTKELMHVSDWFPTLVEGVADVALNANELGLDGVNVWDIIRQGSAGDSNREVVFNIDPIAHRPNADSKYDNHSLIFDVAIQASIRKGHMKLITGRQYDGDWKAPAESEYSDIIANDPPGKAVWLYNITADPNEQHDLSDVMVDTVYELLRRLNDYYTSSKYEPSNNQEPDCASAPALHGGVWTNWE